jgi:hypothetical protein
VNPADHIIKIVNTDFIRDATQAAERIDKLVSAWTTSRPSHDTALNTIEVGMDEKGVAERGREGRVVGQGRMLRLALKNTYVLMERNVLNYRRNLLAYGVRMGMYRGWSEFHMLESGILTLPGVIVGMGILLATVWVNLALEDTKIVRPFSKNTLSLLSRHAERSSLGPLLFRCVPRFHVCRRHTLLP